jgi:pantoate--beta-alanine ligase
VTTVAHTRDALPPPRGRVALVPTMGALHAGHAALIRRARGEAGPGGTVIVSVFVNPTQFAAGEDLDRYPRTLAADVDVCDEAGADVVFAPSAAEVYGPGGTFRANSVTVDPGPLGDRWEGAARPGHFRGVLTVVLKLFGLTRPDLAVFGEKDYQQLVLVTRMVEDLSLPLAIVGEPTVRDTDGLALSSRNRYLSAPERTLARTLPRSLDAVVAAAAGGSGAALAAGRAVLDGSPDVAVDYLEIVAPDLGQAPEHGPARALLAARVGATRLLDTRALDLGGPAAR